MKINNDKLFKKINEKSTNNQNIVIKIVVTLFEL
jgi:hypothetical protein